MYLLRIRDKLVIKSRGDHGYKSALQQVKHSYIYKDANKKEKKAYFYTQGTHNLAGERKVII